MKSKESAACMQDIGNKHKSLDVKPELKRAYLSCISRKNISIKLF
jgi:hypothetical protein